METTPSVQQYKSISSSSAKIARCKTELQRALSGYSATLAPVPVRTLYIAFRAGEPKMTLRQALQNAARGAGANNKQPPYEFQEDQKVQNKSTINCLVYYYNTTKCYMRNTTNVSITNRTKISPTNRTNTTNCISPIGVHSISTILP